jgi:hypothetical protein
MLGHFAGRHGLLPAVENWPTARSWMLPLATSEPQGFCGIRMRNVSAMFTALSTLHPEVCMPLPLSSCLNDSPGTLGCLFVCELKM